MDEISFKGENYVKASVLARKFGYTADYVGQLCRAGQVTATLVGRSWYLTEESLLGHKKGRYRSSLAKSKEMVRKYAELQTQSQKPTNVKRIVRYEEDEGDLMPSLITRQEVSRSEESIPEPEADMEAEVASPETESEEQESLVRIHHAPLLRRQPVPYRATRPSVRTIPSFPVPEIATKRLQHSTPVNRVTPTTTAARRPKKRSLVPALVLTFLLCEALLMTAMLGTEKQLTVREDGSGVVVYNFEPELVAASIKALME